MAYSYRFVRLFISQEKRIHRITMILMKSRKGLRLENDFLSADTETDQNDDIESRLEKLEFRHARLDAYLPVTDSANVVEFASTL